MNITDNLLKDKECATVLGCSVPTFWRRVADGTISRPLKIGGTSRWPQSEIHAVIDRAKAARGSKECSMTFERSFANTAPEITSEGPRPLVRATPEGDPYPVDALGPLKRAVVV
jgi:predicted DNA-binding transcriptional regulator AlpA